MHSNFKENHMHPEKWATKFWHTMIVPLISGTTNPVVLWAASPSLPQQIEALPQGQQANRDEHKAIKKLFTAGSKRPSLVEGVSVTLNCQGAGLHPLGHSGAEAPGRRSRVLGKRQCRDRSRGGDTRCPAVTPPGLSPKGFGERH